MLRTTFRPVSSVDLAAAFASVVLPKAWHPRLDQTRLDLQSVLDSLRGHHEPPFRDLHGGPRSPKPLRTIDPVEHILPRPLAERYAATRRDLRFLSLSLRGHHPPPFTRRQQATQRPRVVEPSIAPNLQTRKFRVAAIEHPIEDAVTLELEAPAGAVETFLPGQFLTLTVEIAGVSHRRAYSVCSSPASLPRLSITIKRVEGGIVSNYLNDEVRVGDLLRVHGPAGTFTVVPDPRAERHFVILAAGAGITPMISIIHDLLHAEPGTRIDLVYGNRSEQSILYRAWLEEMAAAFSERFTVHHMLSRPSPDWKGKLGRVDRRNADEVLDAIVADGSPAQYLVCGPQPMMEEVREALAARGVPAASIRQERFVSPRSATTAALPTTPQPATFSVAGVEHELIVPPTKTLLQAGLDAGLPLGYSCAMGGCGACKVKLRRGSVRMDEPNALTSQEREGGYVLACIAHPTEPVEVEAK
jgi:ring-1,2-phenylacetyl-CoA epoxidase subunit PaaE